jgi:hypothetical protein
LSESSPLTIEGTNETCVMCLWEDDGDGVWRGYLSLDVHFLGRIYLAAGNLLIQILRSFRTWLFQTFIHLPIHIPLYSARIVGSRSRRVSQ